MVYEVGDIVKLKKQHPCGSNDWEILRVGADFRLKCMGCGHQIMIARKLVEKNTKGLQKKAEGQSEHFIYVPSLSLSEIALVDTMLVFSERWEQENTFL